MIELPEALNLAKQINQTLVGKTIADVCHPTSLHKFAFFHGDPKEYKHLLSGREVLSAKGYGIFTDIFRSEDITISFNDGVNLKYGDQVTQIPEKYQLLLTFHDSSFLVFTVAMYGGIFAYKGTLNNSYHERSVSGLSPLSDAFNAVFFGNMILKGKQNLSLKAFLATEQRIPGLGNGSLQDILFNASLNPRSKLSSLSDCDKHNLFLSLKDTLRKMFEEGGRDTETDLFGRTGGYKTILSRNTYKQPCPKCGGPITKEPYLGGAVYYCTVCQPVKN